MQQLPSEIKRNIATRNIATPSGRVRGCGMTPKVLREVAREAATRAGIENLAPHDLWRTCARLCFSGGELGSDSVLAWPCFHVDRDQRRSGERSRRPRLVAATRLLATNRDSNRRSRSRMTRNAPDATSVSTYHSLAPQVGQAGVGGCCWSCATRFVSAP
jgi:hypothetical protein